MSCASSRRYFLRAGLSLAAAQLPVPADELDPNSSQVNLTQLRNAVRLGCSWLTDVAQVKTDRLAGENNSRQLAHKHWRGAMRGEYRAAERKWDFQCPVSHTGQALAALVLAGKVMEDDQYLAAARASAEFIGGERVAERRSKQFGLLFGYEYKGDEVNMAAVLEAIDGLFALSDAAGDRKYSEWGLDAAFWIARNAYLGEGLFRDAYDMKTAQFVAPPWQSDKPGRPLIDDAIFLKAYKRTHNAMCRRIFFAAADRLLKEEDPPGNWIGFAPGVRSTGYLHARQAYWWGYPMIAAWQESGDRKYLDCARRVGDWYLRVLRMEGALARPGTRDARNAPIALDTSAVACAAILWQDLFKETKDERWISAARRALRHCIGMQFREVQDPNLKGALLERVLPPDGTDRSPYYVQDLATIFFIQAACRMLG